jgi:hypothetical protein
MAQLSLADRFELVIAGKCWPIDRIAHLIQLVFEGPVYRTDTQFGPFIGCGCPDLAPVRLPVALI